MTEEQKTLVRESFAKVEQISETAADLFYEKLFELDPSLRHLFRGDMKEQGRKLINMLGLAVKGLNNLNQLVPTVRELGVRHKNYGVKEAHFQTVGAALLWTLDKGLGENFTAEVEEAWTETYLILAGIMKEAFRPESANESVKIV